MGCGQGAERVPQLKLPQTEFDLGTVRATESANCTILVRNIGDAPLVLSKVKGSCSCTVAKLENPEIPPGGETELSITFTAGRRAYKAKKTVSFATNDPQSPTARVSIIANVVTRVNAEPRSLRVKNVSVGDGYTADLVIQPGYDESEWTSVRLVTNFRDVSEIRDVSIKEVPRTDKDIADNRWPYTVMIDKASQAGTIFGQINVYINEEPQPATTVYMTGRIEGRIKVQPVNARFYTRPNQPAPTTTIVLNHVAGQPFDITNIKCDLPFIEWEIDGMTEKDRYEVKVRLRDEVPAGTMHRGKLLVATTEPLQSEISIPIYAQHRNVATSRTSTAPRRQTPSTGTRRTPARSLRLPQRRQGANAKLPAKPAPAGTAKTN